MTLDALQKTLSPLQRILLPVRTNFASNTKTGQIRISNKMSFFDQILATNLAF